jgi:hypothetical protein
MGKWRRRPIPCGPGLAKAASAFRLEFDLLRDTEGVIDLDPEIAKVLSNVVCPSSSCSARMLALDHMRDYRILSSNTGKRRWCFAHPPFADRGGGLRPAPRRAATNGTAAPACAPPASRRTTPLQRLIERDFKDASETE